MAANDNKVARLLMKHCGCHQINIYVLSTKHRKMMEEKKPYDPSNLSTCIPIVNMDSSKDLSSSDDFDQPLVIPESPKIKTIKTRNPLRKTIKAFDTFRRVKSDKHGNPILTAAISERITHSEKLRPSDVIFRIPEELVSKLKEPPTIYILGIRKKKLIRRAVLSSEITKKTPVRSNVSRYDFLEIRRNNILRREPLPYESTESIQDEALLTEDDELMRGNVIFDRQVDSDFAASKHFEVINGHLCIQSEHYLEPKRPRIEHKIIEPDLTAKVIHFSSKDIVFYKDDCMCNFCQLLKQHNGCLLRFSGKFNTEQGHGFFSSM